MDPVTGKKINRKLTSALIRTSKLYNKVDVKNYWEQSHLHGLLTLAEAFNHTGEKKYLDCFFNIFLDWMENNSCDTTINWKCPMDNAIRLVNVVAAIGIINNDEIQRYNENIFRFVYEHTILIREYYENKGDMPNNHFLTDLIGVIWGSVFLIKNYNFLDINNVLEEALYFLNRELQRQVNSDGSDYENSTYYHCFVAELMAETIYMLKENKVNISESLYDIVKKMLGVCEYFGAFESSLPLMGDQDGSRLLLLKGFFDIDRCDFSALARFERYSVIAKKSGIYRYDYGNYTVYVKCGKIGTEGKGTHDHNDQLSICVFLQNKPIIIDGGTYLYTKDTKARALYRSEKKHSTVILSNMHQNDIHSNLFKIYGGNAGRIIQDAESFSGMFWYKKDCFHKREIFFERNVLVIRDFVYGTEKEAISRLLLPVLETDIFQEGGKKIIVKGAISIIIESNENIKVSREKYSPAYGIEKECIALDIKITNNLGIYYIKDVMKC